MGKIKNKLIVSILIVITLFNFIFMENVSYADETFDQVLVGLLGTFVGILSWPLRIVALAGGRAIDLLTGAIAYMDGAMDGAEVKMSITPFEILFNKVQLFDVNFFDFTSVSMDSAVYKIRMSVAGWFYIMRLIAVSILLVILIYMGIRMAISTIAEEKARYKKMMIDWVTSIALVFLLQYIIIFTVNVNNALVNTLGSVLEGNEISDAISAIFARAFGFTIEAFACTVVYCMLVFQTLSLVISYINRMIKIAFLIIISPLISITYSIDKIGDGKSQALDTWLKEFVYSILIQPFHCIIYMVFISVAFDLLMDSALTGIDSPQGWMHDVSSAVLAILCIKFTKDGEKIVRKIFNFKDENNGTSLAAGMALSMAAVSNASKLGKSARKGVNALKSSNMFKAIKEDATTVRAATRAALFMSAERKQGQTFTERTAVAKEEIKDEKNKKYIANNDATKQLNDKIKEIKDKNKDKGINLTDAQIKRQARKEVAEQVREKKKTQGVRGKIRKAKGFIDSFETAKYIKKNVIPAGLGFMAGSMAYGGDANLFTAFATGTATKGAMSEFMSNSTGTIATDISENLVAAGVTADKAEEATANIRVRGDNGEYDADKFKAIVDQIKAALAAAGINESGDKIASKINKEMQVNPNFDLRTMLSGMGINNDNVLDKAQSYKKLRAESNVYEGLKTGESIGLSTDALASAAAVRMPYAIDTAKGINESVDKEEEIIYYTDEEKADSQKGLEGQGSPNTQDGQEQTEGQVDNSTGDSQDNSQEEKEEQYSTEEIKNIIESISRDATKENAVINREIEKLGDDADKIKNLLDILEKQQKYLTNQKDSGTPEFKYKLQLNRMNAAVNTANDKIKEINKKQKKSNNQNS